MRSIPFLLVLAAVVACSSFRDRLQPEKPPPADADRPVPEVQPRPEANNSTPEISIDKDARTVSGGVLNGSAVSLPKPAYPPAARAVRASGQVSVQVTVNSLGTVESAKAVSGHPLLRAAAVAASREAKFSPKLLGGKAVNVTGVLVYDFAIPE